jgi:NADH-dependent peroxiredoxin subunit F
MRRWLPGRGVRLCAGVAAAIDLAEVFLQIGLVPNTGFLKGTVALRRFCTIIVDARGANNVPGMIVVGNGATAAPAAFDHLIQTSAPG